MVAGHVTKRHAVGKGESTTCFNISTVYLCASYSSDNTQPSSLETAVADGNGVFIAFIYCLFNDTYSSSCYIASNDRIWKERVVVPVKKLS
jgi:hypothetical protein